MTAAAVHAAPWVLPIAEPPLRDGAVALAADGTVLAIGPRKELEARGPVEHHPGLLMPGLVNAHTHVELSGLHERIPGGDGLVPWVRRLLALRAAPDESAIQRAALFLRSRGTVAVADIANGDAARGPLLAAGLEVLTLDERLAPRGEPEPTREHAVATPHATYTVGGPQLQALAARSGGRIRSIHVEEDPAEAAYHVAGQGPMAALLDERENRPEGTPSGRRPVAWLDELGVLGEGTLLVHLTFADDDAIAIAARRRCIAVLCPRSNAHITGGLPPVDRLRAAGVRVALGTDSLASSPSLDVLGELPLLAREGAEPAWLIACATQGGADALGLPHLGALVPGRRPGLLAVGDDAEGLRDPNAWLCHEGALAPVRRLA